MSDLTHTTRALLNLLRHRPELLDDEANREELRDFVVILRAIIDDANNVALRVALTELEQDFPSSAE